MWLVNIGVPRTRTKTKAKTKAPKKERTNLSGVVRSFFICWWLGVCQLSIHLVTYHPLSAGCSMFHVMYP